MCTNKIRYFNKWNHSWQWSDCGHCHACQQQKAFRRTKRIKNASWKGYVPLFVTLTYSNLSVPYIRKSDYNDDDSVNLSSLFIRRDVDFRRVRVSGDYQMLYKPVAKFEPLETIDCFEAHIFVDSKQIFSLPDLKKKKGCIGVLYYKDLQNFEKRLRINLERRFDVHEPVYTFKVSEYGPTTFRPHFHLLIYVPITYLEKCKRAIAESWPFDNKNVISRNIEIARNAASYVSSYCNRGADFPKFFENNAFKPKHSFSKDFGFQNPQFTLEHIITGIGRGSLRYTATRNRNGYREVADILLPKYFINRYFLKFKGYSRLSRNQISLILRKPAILYHSSSEWLIRNRLCLIDEYDDIDWNQVNVVFNAITLRYRRFLADFVYRETIDGVEKTFVGLPDNEFSRQLFADIWYRVFNVYASNLYEDSFKGFEVNSSGDILQCYNNLAEVRDKRYIRTYAYFYQVGQDGRLWQHKELLSEVPVTDLLPLIDSHPEIENPNNFHDVVCQSNMMENIYNSTFKRKRVTNVVMSRMGINV